MKLLYIVFSIILVVLAFFLLLYFHIWILNASKNNSNVYIHNNLSTIKNLTFKISNNTKILNFENNNILTSKFNKSKIALIKPTFTAAAYDKSFYVFFKKYIHTPLKANITSNLNLLNAKIVNKSKVTGNIYAMLSLMEDLKWTSNAAPTTVLTDQDVDKGSLFTKYGWNVYDVVILGHQEYVTQKEYDNLRKFVYNGGTMIILDGNVFYAEVNYFEKNNTISLVKGHGWAYNGKSAWKSVNERWTDETKEWVGSNYLCYLCVKEFKNNPFNYFSHEEQYLTNSKDIILLNYLAHGMPNTYSKNITVATYELSYGAGKVIALGIYADDAIKNTKFKRFFESLLRYSLKPD